MIIYKGIFEKLKAAGYTTTRLRNEKLIPEAVLTNIRRGRSISLATLDKICSLTKLPVGELIEYREDDNENKSL